MFKILRNLSAFMATLLIMAGCTLPGLGGSGNGQGISITGGTSTEMDMMGYLIQGMVKYYIEIGRAHV